MLNYITLKFPSDLRSQPLQNVNDNATDKLVTSYVSITDENGKAPAIYSFVMTIYSKMSLHAFGSGLVDLQVILVYGETILKKWVLE